MTALFLLTILIAFSAGWAVCNDLKDRRAEREAARARRAEDACEELRAALMRGATVATWHRPAPIPPGADAFYFHVKTTKGDILLTEEQMAVGLERATKHLTRHVL